MTETYYYMWEFFTSITILALIAVYVIYDRKQIKKAKEKDSGNIDKSKNTDNRQRLKNR